MDICEILKDEEAWGFFRHVDMDGKYYGVWIRDSHGDICKGNGDSVEEAYEKAKTAREISEKLWQSRD